MADMLDMEGDTVRAVSPSCRIGEHACRAWKSCECACHKGMRAKKKLDARKKTYADCPF